MYQIPFNTYNILEPHYDFWERSVLKEKKKVSNADVMVSIPQNWLTKPRLLVAFLRPLGKVLGQTSKRSS
jgi:hypothetical protein